LADWCCPLKYFFEKVRGAKQFEKLIEEKDFVAVFW